MFKYDVKRNPLMSLLLILTIACLIGAELLAVLSSLATANYAISSIMTVALVTEGVIIALALVYILSTFLKGSVWMIIFDVVRLIATACICICLYMVLSERATLMGYLWFSTLETGNVSAELALTEGVISCVLYLAALAALACSGIGELVDARKRMKNREEILEEIQLLNEQLETLDKIEEVK